MLLLRNLDDNAGHKRWRFVIGVHAGKGAIPSRPHAARNTFLLSLGGLPFSELAFLLCFL